MQTCAILEPEKESTSKEERPMKKVLILSGSPRKDGNSDLLCSEFMRGAQESGNEVQKIFVRSKKIVPCNACYYCRDHGGKCALNDDMSEILDAMQAADVIVMASPVYFYSIDAQICEVKPTILQTEVHPYAQQKELKAFLAENGMVIQAWYPLGHADKGLLEEPLFTRLAAKYGKSNVQIILRWHIQAGNVVIPGSKNPAHIHDNFDVFDFALTDAEMQEITTLNKDKRYYEVTEDKLAAFATMFPPVDDQK